MLALKRYFGSLIVVLTLLAAYALAVAPWLEPPPIVRKESSPVVATATGAAASDAELKALFSPGSWELDQPKIFPTEDCTILVKDYKPTRDGKLELTPCTLIFYATSGKGPAAKRRPIVLQAPQGAVIQFDRPLDFARAEFGKLVGGSLPGEITIFSPATAPGAHDRLHLTTRNIHIDKQRVYTTEEVVFNYGDSHGRGRDLTIALLPKDAEDPNSGIGGVRSLKLEHIERLHLATKGMGILPDLPGQKGRKAAVAAPLEVTCQGPFVFDVTSETALFDEGVVVERINPAGPPDKLTCRQLLLAFAEEAGPLVPIGQAPPAQQTAPTDSLAGLLKRVVAIGSPVTLEAPSSATRAVAARIEYSLAKRRLVLAPGQGAEQVSLRQAQNEFTARELEYELSEPGRLGRMWAAGPGNFKFMQTAGKVQQTIVAQWDKELRIQPDGQHQVISLVENASITADPLGHFAADELHFWVRETETRAGEAPAEPRNPKRAQPAKTAILPDRLLASGRVTVKSPRLNVTTYRLEMWFHNLPARPVPLPPIEPIRPVARAAFQASDAGRSQPNPAPIEPPSLQHVELAGDLIQMQIIRQGDEMELENLTIRGHVVLDETQTPEPGQKPIRITGDRLELRGGVTGPGKIDVIGQPAEIAGRGLSLLGSEIHVVRVENRLWIDGPGEAKLPAATAGDREQGTNGAAGNALRGVPGVPRSAFNIPSSPIHVVWRDGLTFDGQTASVSGDVQARTETQVATCQTLDLTLSRRVDFAAPTSAAQPEMARLAMEGGVHLVSRSLDEAGKQQSLMRVQVQDLVIDRTAGTLYANGPGWASSTHLANARLPGLPMPMPMPMAVKPPADPAAPPALNNVHITFEGAIVGNLARSEIEFQRQVRTTFMPVGDWGERVVVERLEDLGEKGVLMTSERLTVTEMAPAGQRPWLEASAASAIVDGKSFKVSAPRISYTSDKEVLTLEGDGRADAELWYQTLPGQPSSYGAARKWRYWLRTGMFDVEDARPLEFQLNGIDKIRLPGRR